MDVYSKWINIPKALSSSTWQLDEQKHLQKQHKELTTTSFLIYFLEKNVSSKDF